MLEFETEAMTHQFDRAAASISIGVQSAFSATIRNPLTKTDEVQDGCLLDSLLARLRHAGLRATRHRVFLGWLLFAKGHRHLTAELLFNEAAEARARASLATVYNTLKLFAEAGMLRKVATDGAQTYYDTNLRDHHHLFIKETGLLIDIPTSEIEFQCMPNTPAGLEISRVDVIVTLRLKPEGGRNPDAAAGQDG